jgi:TRAP-type transport system periplasmic protein
MDQQIKDAVAWSKEEQGVEVITLPADEKAEWDGKITFMVDDWIEKAKAKGFPAEEIINDIKAFIQ